MIKTTKIVFPVYRKNKTGKSFYKIVSENAFTEIQLLGKRKFVFHFEAKTFNDYYLIHDMLHNHEKHWHIISEEEFYSATNNLST